MKYLFYFATTLCSVLFWSCNQDSSVLEPQVESEGGVSFCVPAFEQEDGSRVNITINESTGANFTWGADDKIGTFSNEGGLLRFDIKPSDANSNEAHFMGAGFALEPTAEYCSFYPFKGEAMLNRVPVDYTGQTQVGNNSTAHLGAYDHIYSPFQSTNARGEVIFEMKHLGSLVRFQFTMPAADTYSRFRIVGFYGCRFLSKGYYDLNNATPTIKWSTPGSFFLMNLQDIETTAPGQVITLYAMLAPENYTNKFLTFEITGEHGYYINTTGLTGKYGTKDLQPGKSYRIDESLSYIRTTPL